MRAHELAEEVKDWLQVADMLPLSVNGVETRWGYGEADFFVDLGSEGTFVVSVIQVTE